MGEAIDFVRLSTICKSKIKHITRNDFKVIYKGQRRCFFKDNGAKILGVSHLDTVQPRGAICDGQIQAGNDTLWFSPFLDDRLGVYTMLDLLPRLNVQMDILLTTDEEIGQSTADLFKAKKEYNWIVEFDRRGEDVVLYDFGSSWGESDNDWELELERCKFRVATGTNSDITRMEGVGCKAMNMGIAYVDEHQLKSYFSVGGYYRQIRKFINFYNKNVNTRFPHTITPKKNFWASRGGGYGNLVGGHGSYPSLPQHYRPANNDHDVPQEWEDWRKANNKNVEIPKKESRCPICRNSLIDGKCVMCGATYLPIGE